MKREERAMALSSHIPYPETHTRRQGRPLGFRSDRSRSYRRDLRPEVGLLTIVMRALDISASLSPVRLHRFVKNAGGLVQGLRLYRWDAQVASAYWTPLHFLEVAVRNAVHDALSSSFGTPTWYEASPGVGATWLYPFEQEAVTKAIEKIHAPVTPGKVVAELHFGFWVGLVSGRYLPAEGGTDYHDRIWVRGGVSSKFGGAKRSVIHKRLDRLRRFRNRIAHHEHLMDQNLDQMSSDIDSILKTLDPALATWVRAVSAVAETRASRPC